MSTALATQDVNMDELKRLGMMLALSGYFDQHNDQGVATAQMCVKVLAGREIGFGPFAAVNGIHIIKGKPSISANIMAAAVKSHPTYDYRVRVMTDKEVAIDFFEIMDGKREKIGTSEFNAADAAKAGTQNMGKFPRNMLFARAMSNGVRWYCPDVFSGNSVYTPEELGARTDDDGYIIVDRASGEIIESPKPAPKQPAIKSLSEVEPLSFDAPLGAIDEFLAIPSPKTGQTAKEHTESQAAQASSAGAISAGQLKRLHALGTQLYGDGWDDKRHELVENVTAGKSTSSNDLTTAEASRLIAGMERKIEEAAAA
jgi:hypothetical protein